MKRATIFILVLATLFSLSACKHKHSFGEWSTSREPTCEKEGEQVRTCSCGEVQKESISKLSHSPVTIEKVSPSCNSVGYTEGVMCEDCEAYLSKPTVISPAHTYSTVSPGPTCTEPKICLVCSEVAESKLGHTVSVGVCDRCKEFVPPTIELPPTPIKAELKITGCETEFQITDIDYKFIENSLIITYSGTKTKDEGEFSDGRYVCGFSYTLVDANGATVATGNASITNLSANDTVANKSLVIDMPNIMTDRYTLSVGNYLLSLD